MTYICVIEIKFNLHEGPYDILKISTVYCIDLTVKKTKNSVVLVHKRTILTEQPQPVGEVSANLADRGCRVVSATDPRGHNLGFLDLEAATFPFK
jgi:hypothetical protein